MADNDLIRIRDLMVGLANDWAAATGPRDLHTAIAPVLAQIDGWDDMCAATWVIALLAADALRTAHAIEPGQQLPLVFVDATDGTHADAADVPPPIRAAGRYFAAAVSNDVETGAAIWETVPQPPDEISGEAAAFLNAVWFASLEAYRKAHQVGSNS